MTISSRVKFLCYNILAEGTTTVTGTDSGYPKERLYDHSTGFYCMYSSVGAYVVSINQSASPLSVDALVIEDHNLNGVAVTWDHSANGSDWTEAAAWTQSGTGQIFKQLTTPVTANYWRVSMASHAFQSTEIFMGRALSVPVIWSNTPSFTEVADVEQVRTYGGVDHFIRIGPKRRRREYTVFMNRIEYPVATFTANLEYLDDYSKPFYLVDHEEACFLADFSANPPSSEHLNEGIMQFSIAVVEVKG